MTATEKAKIERWLDEARQALCRQRYGPWDRGDGSIIFNALSYFLDLVTPDEIVRIQQAKEWTEIHEKAKQGPQ